ncbi:MAG: HDOD domain-containing protein [Pseudomonadota bacterium]
MAEPETKQLQNLCNLLEPVGALDARFRDELIREVHCETLAPRSLLVAEDESEWLTYVVNGEVALLSGGFVKESVVGGSQRALEPLFLEEEVDRAITELGAQVIQFSRAKFQDLYRQEQSAATELVEIDLSDAENQIFHAISQAFANDSLELPNFPDVALKVRQAVNSPDISATEVSQIVQADPVLAACLMQVANSPLYRGWKDVQSVRDAISRLGLESTRSLAVSLAVKPLFKARSAMVKKRIKALYQQSTYISAISYVLAQRETDLDPERALFAGLIHDIGTIPILNYIDKNSDLAPSSNALEKTIASLKAPVGAILVSAWDFDAELVALVEMGDDWSRDSTDAVDYADIVLAARWHCLFDTGFTDDLPAHSDISANRRLGLNVADDNHMGFLEEARDEIALIHQILQI